jgi:hypothetical protein
MDTVTPTEDGFYNYRIKPESASHETKALIKIRPRCMKLGHRKKRWRNDLECGMLAGD